MITYLNSFLTTTTFKISSRLITLFCFSLLARSFDLSDFGNISFKWVILNTFIPVFLLGGNVSVIKKFDYKTFLSALFLTTTILILSVFVIILTSDFNLISYKISPLLLLSTYFLSVIRIISAAFRKKKKIVICEFIEQLAPALLFLGSIILGFWKGIDGEFEKIFFFISFFALLLSTTVFYISEKKFVNEIFNHLKEIQLRYFDIKYSLRVFSNNLYNLLSFNITRITSNFLLNSKSVGITQPAFQIVVSVNALSNALKLTSISFSKKHEINSEKNINQINKVLSFQLIVLGIIIFFSEEIISLIYGSKFSTFSNYINILVFGQVISVLVAPIVPILLIHNKEKIVSILSKLCLLINICGNIYFLKEESIIGALFSTSFSILFFSLTLIIYNEFILNKKLILKRNLVFALFLIILNILINFL